MEKNMSMKLLTVENAKTIKGEECKQINCAGNEKKWSVAVSVL